MLFNYFNNKENNKKDIVSVNVKTIYHKYFNRWIPIEIIEE